MKKFLLILTAVVALTAVSKIMVVGAQEMAAAPEAMTDMAMTNEFMNEMNALGNEMNAMSNEVANEVANEVVEDFAPAVEGMTP